MVFTDIEGSTRLLHELGQDAYLQALARHREVVREAFARYEGYEVDYEGDAFFYAFPSASGALSAVQETIERLAAGPIRLRVGVHTGEPGLDPPKYVGMDVHRAARIMSAGHGGQVVLSRTTRNLLDERFQLRDLGEHRLKDLSAAEHIYQLGAGEFPPLKSLYRTNLPVPATLFLGRERELAEVVALLERKDVSLLTLTGPGGTGKTRLALQAAAEASEGFPDGLFWVPLAPLRDPVLVLSSVAQTLEVKEQPGRELADSLGERLAGKRLLLLLDNIEQLLPDAASAIARLPNTDGPTVMVTSRERLQLQGEQRYEVPALVEADGIELFTTRARALRDSFVPSEAVAEVCARLDNLPLALELAAARSTLFSPEQLLDRLGERLDLFKGARDADPRQQTLRATIEWSYDLLTAEEQRLFRRLSMFSGGCTYEAAEQVCDALPDTLQSLLDKSLLRRRDDPTGEPRYWLLETIREYALESLRQSGGLGEARRRHAGHFLALAEQADAESRSGDQSEWFGRLDRDSANLRAAIDWTRDAGEPDLTLRFATALWGYWFARGYVSEGKRWLEEALSLTTERPARALLGLCALRLLAADDSREVLEDARRALRACEELGDDYSLAQAWNLIGRLEASGLGEVSAGERSLERALAYAERGDYPAERAESMGWLMVMAIFGPLPTAEGIERCKRFFAKAGDDATVHAFAQVERAVLEAMRGEFELARQLLADGTQAFQTLGLKVWAANNAQEAFYVEMLAGNPQGASTVLRASYDALEEMGERGFLSTIAGFLAHALYAQGEDEEADLFSRRSEAAAASDDVISQVLWRSSRAKVSARGGELDRAEELARQAVGLVEQSELLNAHADALSDLAEVLAACGRSAEARSTLVEAARRYERKGNLVALRHARERADELASTSQR